MKKSFFLSLGLLLTLLLVSSCRTVYPAQNVYTGGEGCVVVVRPEHYSLFGTSSIRDLIEITYCEFSQDDMGYAHVRVGIRNRGAQHWWSSRGTNIQLSATTKFYREAVGNIGNVSQAPVHEGERQTIQILRGETADFADDCPVEGIGGFQVVISEQ